jgi:hypothetical protein
MSSAPTSLRRPTDDTSQTKAMSDKSARLEGPAGSNWIIVCLPCEHVGLFRSLAHRFSPFYLCAFAALRAIFLGFSGGRSVALKTILQFERIYLAKPVFF